MQDMNVINIPCRLLKTDQLMRYCEIIAVSSENHTRSTQTLWGQKANFMDNKLGGIQTNHWVLKMIKFLQKGKLRTLHLVWPGTCCVVTL